MVFVFCQLLMLLCLHCDGLFPASYLCCCVYIVMVCILSVIDVAVFTL